jgi:hypothetical protein
MICGDGNEIGVRKMKRCLSLVCIGETLRGRTENGQKGMVKTENEKTEKVQFSEKALKRQEFSRLGVRDNSYHSGVAEVENIDS